MYLYFKKINPLNPLISTALTNTKHYLNISRILKILNQAWKKKETSVIQVPLYYPQLDTLTLVMYSE